jgi:hypothetical protein
MNPLTLDEAEVLHNAIKTTLPKSDLLRDPYIAGRCKLKGNLTYGVLVSP